MPIPLELESLDLLPDDLKPLAEKLYRQDGGRFRLDADVPDVAALKRGIEHERRQVSDTAKARDALKAQLAETEARLKELEAGGGKAAADDEDRVKAALSRQDKVWQERYAVLEKAINEEKGRRESSEQKLAETRIVEGLRQVGAKLGVAEAAMVDFINRARGTWRLNGDSGDPTPYDGDALLYSEKDVTKPMTMEEHGARIVKDAPHLLRPSTGAGAPSGATRTPGSAGAFVLTKDQAKDVNLYRSTRAAAEKAGQTVSIEG